MDPNLQNPQQENKPIQPQPLSEPLQPQQPVQENFAPQPRQPQVDTVNMQPQPPVGQPAAPQPIAQQPMQQPQMAQSPGMQPEPPKKKKTGLIIGIIIAVLVLLGLIGFGVYAAYNGVKNASGSTQDGASADAGSTGSSKDNNAVAADSESDYSIVCKGGTVTNAAASDAPVKITSFYADPSDDSYSSLSVGYDAAYYPDYENPTEINVVACLEGNDTTAAKEQACEFKTSGETISVDYYSLQYKLTYYDAGTGKKLGVNDSVAAPATSCPFSALLKDGETKLYAEPDKTTVEQLHTAFVAS